MNQFTSQQLLEEIGRIGGKIPFEIKVYLIGGCSMSLRGLKPSTKDVDLVFTAEKDLNAFAGCLEKFGFEKVFESTPEYEKLETQAIYKKQGDAGFDLFLNKVCGGLRLSDGMKKRASDVRVFGKLEVLLCSEEDVFLFKSITERPRDVDDMAALVEAKRDAFDWNAFKTEVEEQTPHYPNLPTLAYNKLVELKEKHEMSLFPITSWLKKKSNEQIVKLEVRNRMDGGMTKEDALESLVKLGFSKKELEKILKS